MSKKKHPCGKGYHLNAESDVLEGKDFVFNNRPTEQDEQHARESQYMIVVRLVPSDFDLRKGKWPISRQLRRLFKWKRSVVSEYLYLHYDIVDQTQDQFEKWFTEALKPRMWVACAGLNRGKLERK